MCICVYIYIYTCIERERERERWLTNISTTYISRTHSKRRTTLDTGMGNQHVLVNFWNAGCRNERIAPAHEVLGVGHRVVVILPYRLVVSCMYGLYVLICLVLFCLVYVVVCFKVFCLFVTFCFLLFNMLLVFVLGVGHRVHDSAAALPAVHARDEEVLCVSISCKQTCDRHAGDRREVRGCSRVLAPGARRWISSILSSSLLPSLL